MITDKVEVTLVITPLGFPAYNRVVSLHPAGIHWYAHKTADTHNAKVEAFVNGKCHHKIDLRKGAALRSLILAVESQLENEEICISDIEFALYNAREEYYKMTGQSVEGEK
ncbi:hypothetical protein AVV67_gp041 [Escherichia phage vB_EcoM_VR25]|uniref:Uncharacterized protein n=2 Tax=Gaprivervirus TaxID=1913654 RepID=A0A0A7HFT2_9CAUD|nr:hypothetical protein VR7_gp042 [Escherichia phage vB_EcoM_VR7]YP_009209783.1 hypothetical protein AVV67_gp041 [Escherichia phage vB_EcoM_VR25]ADR32417.1 hypothetical protein VR7_gp042 [Escherichia phage vB_EcoM_VR7]AIZ02385.1 hypothetical protein VR25_041 [Escherichia phage vB_EcoM_VR25]